MMNIINSSTEEAICPFKAIYF